MSETVFFDPICPKPYSSRTLIDEALGGTEATVVRIAERLDAAVMQHNRVDPVGRYVRPKADQTVRNLVVVRDPRAVQRVASMFPNARVFLWCHDLVNPGSSRASHLARIAAWLAKREATIICVSDFQRRQIEAALPRSALGAGIRILRIYNPIDDNLAPNGARVDASKLVFLSSPNKGLPFSMDAFRALRRVMPELQIHIANPGYRSIRQSDTPGVVWLGPLPHAQVLQVARSALCVFAPNFERPETFGLIYAEANAVGTPVLAHACGAAPEVMAEPRQLLPVTRSQLDYARVASWLPAKARTVFSDFAARREVFRPYVQRIGEWHAGNRPVVRPDPRFRLNGIAEEWRQTLSA